MNLFKNLLLGSRIDREHVPASDQQKAKELLTNNLQFNLNKVQEIIGNSSELTIKQFRIGDGSIPMAVVYTDGLADKQLLDNFVLEPLMGETKQSADLHSKLLTHPDPMSFIKETVLTIEALVDITDFESLLLAVLSGDSVILMENKDRGMVVGTRGGEHRSVEEPSAQSIIRGPREGFTESLRTNTAMIRLKIKDPRLWLESREIGKVTRTGVAVMYLKGIADDSVVNEIRQRLDRIDIDSILESGDIEEYIQDETWSPFPTIANSERPDVIAAGLLEGRVAILVDGTPFVLIAPALFVQYFQSAEDYYQRWDISSLIRLIRYLCFFIALCAPSLYIAITTFHQEMVPTSLLISLVSQREACHFLLFLRLFGLIVIVLHLCSIRSFGIPYMSSIAPFYLSEQKDTLFRLPRWVMTSRPYSVSRKRVTDKQQDSQMKKNLH